MKWDKETELLEEQFNKRGLQFTAPFEGLSLMQAYGYLDGKRFYFHLRNGDASLCVGVYDRAAEMRKVRQTSEDPTPKPGSRAGQAKADIPKETDSHLFPSVVLLASHIESDRERLVDLFSSLIDNLKPVEISQK